MINCHLPAYGYLHVGLLPESPIARPNICGVCTQSTVFVQMYSTVKEATREILLARVYSWLDWTRATATICMPVSHVIHMKEIEYVSITERPQESRDSSIPM